MFYNARICVPNVARIKKELRGAESRLMTGIGHRSTLGAFISLLSYDSPPRVAGLSLQAIRVRKI